MTDILLGYEVGTGEPVRVPLRHIAVTGQTQQSGKTTTLEALAQRSGETVLTFITKIGEGSFTDARRVAPYFRDRADWQFVTSIIDATLQEKNKFLRPWIMKICRTTKSLADVQEAVREALKTAKGLNEGVYTQLDAYLELIVPEIQRADLAGMLELKPGINAMDLSSFATPMQMLFVQSALDWVNERCRNTIVVIPEAWEFIPEGKGSPVKKSAVDLVRKGGGIGNHIWVDSQDMAGVDKVILRGCTVWLIGVQREANEIKRNLANIPAGFSCPKRVDIALLECGQFFACFGKVCVKVYVRPAWMDENDAIMVAKGKLDARAARPPQPKPKGEPTVKESEALALREENAGLQRDLAHALNRITELERKPEAGAPKHKGGNRPPTPLAASAPLDVPVGQIVTLEQIIDELRRRVKDEPGLVRVLVDKPQLEVKIQRRTIEVDGATLRGRITKLLAEGFFDDGATNSGTRTALKRTGPDTNNANIGNVLNELLRWGFLTLEGDRFVAVKGMKVNIVEG